MTIEFVVAHAVNNATASCAFVREALIQAFETEGLDDDPTEIERMVIPQHWRDEAELIDKEGRISRRCVLGFSLELPDYLATNSDLLTEFIDSLRATPFEAHVVRFEDPLLFDQLQQWSAEIFALEMKLRRALTLIYLVAPTAGDPYDLLHEETVTTQTTRHPEQMEKAVENEFFHLLFSNYPSLNRRPEPKIEKLLKAIRTAEDFATLQNELKRTPIQKDTDLGLLADLLQYSKPIEDMRNCVAHYRRPSRQVLDSYNNANPRLNSMLDAFLALLQLPDEE
jgi:hypothetical protein